jgi:hypothetical protein
MVGVVVSTAVGGITGGSLQDSLDGIADPRFGIHSPHAPGRSVVTFMIATAYAGALVGSAMATAQWRILRRRAAHEWCWISANIVVVGIGAGAALSHCLSKGRRRAQ